MVVFYNGPNDEGREKFKSFYDLSRSEHISYVVPTKARIESTFEQSGEIPYVDLNKQFVC